MEEIGDDRVIEGLSKFLSSWMDWTDPAASQRVAAIEILTKVGSAKAVEALVAALSNEDTRVVQAAENALREVTTPTVEALIKAIGKRPSNLYGYQLQKSAIVLLGELGDACAVRPLSKVLENGSDDVRLVAAAALAKIGGASSAEVLVTALGDRNSTVGNSAAKALAQIGAPAIATVCGALSDETDDRTPEYLMLDSGLLTDGAGRRRTRHIIEILLQISDLRALAPEPFLSKLARLGEKDIEKAMSTLATAHATDLLCSSIAHGSKHIRIYAAQNLIVVSDARAFEPLIVALNDAEAKVREHAIHALGKIKDTRAVEALISVLKPDAAGGQTSNRNYWENRRAIDALAEIGNARAIPAVVEQLHNPDFAKHLVTPLLRFGERDAAELVTLLPSYLEATECLETRWYAALTLTGLGSPPPRARLCPLLLDWIKYVCEKHGRFMDADERLTIQLAAAAGIDSDAMNLASGALGHSWYKARTGGVGGYDGGMSQIRKLCLRGDVWSSAILYRVALKNDYRAEYGQSDWDGEPFFTVLSFEQERRMARDELQRRGYAIVDPGAQRRGERTAAAQRGCRYTSVDPALHIDPSSPQDGGRPAETVPAGPVLCVSVVSKTATVSMVGDRYRFQIRLEGNNNSSVSLGWSGVTINVPTIHSREQYLGTEIQMSSFGCNAPSQYGPGDAIWGFLDDGSFGAKPSRCLLMEAVCEHWETHQRIALEVVILTPSSNLDLHVRVWSTHPERAGGFGDPDWKAAAQKDQQGIPAYVLSVRSGPGLLGRLLGGFPRRLFGRSVRVWDGTRV